MAIITCPNCNHDALFISDEVLESKKGGDAILAKDFKIISFQHASSLDQRPVIILIDAINNDIIECKNCKTPLGNIIQKIWKEYRKKALVKEWDI